IVFQGGNALGSLYAAVGASDLALAVETVVRRLAVEAPLALAAMIVVPAVVVLLIVLTGRRGGDSDGSEAAR
nr:hypothetical protein [Chloroflexota bacterium]